jgi:hypothetical protein
MIPYVFSLVRRYLFAVLFLLSHNVLSYAANLLWTFHHGLIIPLRTVLAAAEDPRRCRRQGFRADNVLTDPSISPSHGASHPIDQRPNI